MQIAAVRQAALVEAKATGAVGVSNTSTISAIKGVYAQQQAKVRAPSTRDEYDYMIHPEVHLQLYF
jgi:hypothetical protein